MTTDDLREPRLVSRLITLLDLFQQVHDRISIEQIKTFLAVAESEGRSVKEYADRSGIPMSTMSRHLLDLGERNRKKEEGLNLLEARRDQQDYRRWNYRLSPKGRKLFKDIQSL